MPEDPGRTRRNVPGPKSNPQLSWLVIIIITVTIQSVLDQSFIKLLYGLHCSVYLHLAKGLAKETSL